MKLVWTYNILAKVGNKNEERKTILINYYIVSIKKAKSLGYYCIMYTDSFSKKYFEKIVDEIHICDQYENSIQWDCYKVYALEDRNDDFVLIDGDVILNDKLPKFDADVVFDTYEVANWKKEYEPVIKQFTELGIGDVIEEWATERKNVFSCGILYFKNDENRKLYVQQWKKYNNFLNEIIKTNDVDRDVATMVGGQYLVTLLALHHGYSYSNINSYLGENSRFYKHHCGPIKYSTPIVPNNYILDIDKKSLV